MVQPAQRAEVARLGATSVFPVHEVMDVEPSPLLCLRHAVDGHDVVLPGGGAPYVDDVVEAAIPAEGVSRPPGE